MKKLALVNPTADVVLVMLTNAVPFWRCPEGTGVLIWAYSNAVVKWGNGHEIRDSAFILVAYF